MKNVFLIIIFGVYLAGCAVTDETTANVSANKKPVEAENSSSVSIVSDYDVIAQYKNPKALERLKNSKILAPNSDTYIQLLDGKGSYETAEGSASRGTVSVVDEIHAYWNFSLPGREDLSVILTSNNGGLETLYYLALFDISNGDMIKKAEAFLGDRIRITDMGIGEYGGYHMGVSFLVHEEGKSRAAEPTVKSNRSFYVNDDQTIEEFTGDPALP